LRRIFLFYHPVALRPGRHPGQQIASVAFLLWMIVLWMIVRPRAASGLSVLPLIWVASDYAPIIIGKANTSGLPAIT